MACLRALLLGVTETGTFEHGTSVLRLAQPIERYMERDRRLLENALPQLFAARSQRLAPDRDDKIITAWNGIMASAFAQAGLALAAPHYVQAAESAMEFVLSHLVVDGRLQRTWKDGKAHIPALADDGALVGALIDLFEATGKLHWLQLACTRADTPYGSSGTREWGCFTRATMRLRHPFQTHIGRVRTFCEWPGSLGLCQAGCLGPSFRFGRPCNRILRTYPY